MTVAACFLLTERCGRSGDKSADQEPVVAESVTPQEKLSRTDRPLDFVSETIDIVVGEGSFTVTGHYRLRFNDPSLRYMPLNYPFPVDAHMHFPERVTVTGNDSARELPVEEIRELNAVMFTVRPAVSDSFTVTYTQKTEAARACYILTTTASWGEPLESAVFTVTVPESFRNVELSYKPDRMEKRGDTIVYTIDNTDFMPDRDLVITWHDERRSDR